MPVAGSPASSALATATRRVGALDAVALRTRSTARRAASFGAPRRSSASGLAPCVGPSATGAIAISIPDAAGSRRASNAGRRPASTSASNVRRATDPRSPCALTPAWRGCAGRQINRAKKTAKKATATAQLLATTEELANLNLNPTAPQGSMSSFLQLTQLALAATNVLLGAHSRG